MENRCLHIPKQGINKGIICHKKIAHGDYCKNHKTAALNLNNFHQCPYIFKSGPNEGSACNKRLHRRFAQCTIHGQKKSSEQLHKYYIKYKERIAEERKKYYEKNIDRIKQKLAEYRLHNKKKG